MTGETCDLDRSLWAICFTGGTWPPGDDACTYAEAVRARDLAVKNHPGDTFTITTKEAAKRYENNTTANV